MRFEESGRRLVVVLLTAAGARAGRDLSVAISLKDVTDWGGASRPPIGA
jgi:hypothetical protein